MTQFNEAEIATIAENIYTSVSGIINNYSQIPVKWKKNYVLSTQYQQLEQVQDFYTRFSIQRTANREYMRIALLTEELTETRIAAENLVKFYYQYHNEDVKKLQQDTNFKRQAFVLLAEYFDGLADIMYILHGGIVEFCSTETEITTTPSYISAGRFLNQDGVYMPKFIEEVTVKIRSKLLNFYGNNGADFGDFYGRIIAEIYCVVYLPLLRLPSFNGTQKREIFALVQSVFNEVHYANMRKLDANGQPILRTDGKILKPDNWCSADIPALISESLFSDVQNIINFAANL